MSGDRSIFAWDEEWREGRGDEDMGEAFVETLAERLIAEIEAARSEAEIQRLIDGNISHLAEWEYQEIVEAKRLRTEKLRAASSPSRATTEG